MPLFLFHSTMCTARVLNRGAMMFYAAKNTNRFARCRGFACFSRMWKSIPKLEQHLPWDEKQPFRRAQSEAFSEMNAR